MAAFHKKFSEINMTLVTGNTEQVEQLLLNKEIDLGVVEGFSRKPTIKYTEFVKDQIVLVANTNNPQAKKQSISLEELKKIPLLLRETGSGTLEIMNRALKPLGIKIDQLNIEMQLDSSESMKLYMLHSNCMAFISINAVRKELASKECCIINVKGLDIKRSFYFIQTQGYAAPLPELFMRFAAHYNLKG
jgi:DNA-binding transcriptional LysR family regulator